MYVEMFTESQKSRGSEQWGAKTQIIWFGIEELLLNEVHVRTDTEGYFALLGMRVSAQNLKIQNYITQTCSAPAVNRERRWYLWSITHPCLSHPRWNTVQTWLLATLAAEELAWTRNGKNVDHTWCGGLRLFCDSVILWLLAGRWTEREWLWIPRTLWSLLDNCHCWCTLFLPDI